MKCLTMDEISLWHQASMTKKITEGDVLIFAGLTGDVNPVHVDKTFAATSRFGRRIAHGLLPASLIASTLGLDLPGAGSVYFSQTLNFMAPVYIDDVLTAELEVIEKDVERNRLTLRAVIYNQDNTVVIEGISVTKPAKEKVTLP